MRNVNPSFDAVSNTLVADSSYAGTSWTNLLVLSLTVQVSGIVCVMASFSARNSLANNSALFRLYDSQAAVAYNAAAVCSTTANLENSGSIVQLITGLTEGQIMNLALQWKVDPGGTISCNHVTRPDMAHASLAAFAIPMGA